MRIAVDAMGGDFAPEQVVAGARLAAGELDAIVVLAGPPEAIESCLRAHGPRPDNIEIEPATDVIAMGESPRAALCTVRPAARVSAERVSGCSPRAWRGRPGPAGRAARLRLFGAASPAPAGQPGSPGFFPSAGRRR